MRHWGNGVQRMRQWVNGMIGMGAVAMLLALTSFSNFGIVARYRVMAFPPLWMLFIGEDVITHD